MCMGRCHALGRQCCATARACRASSAPGAIVARVAACSHHCSGLFLPGTAACSSGMRWGSSSRILDVLAFRTSALERTYAQRWWHTARGRAAKALTGLLLVLGLIAARERWHGLLVLAAAFLALQPHLVPRHHTANLLGIVTSLAAVVVALVGGYYGNKGGSVSATMPVLAIIALTVAALHSRWVAELALRELFLEERQLASKVYHFYSLLAGMLPPHLIRRYFELCLDMCSCPDLESKSIEAVSMGELRPSCGVLFVEICDFDNRVAGQPAHRMVRFLNMLFSSFDEAVTSRAEDGITKIETVGGTYVAASNLFPAASDGDDDADSSGDDWEHRFQGLASVASAMHEIAESTGASLRAGLHFGEVVAGIVGDKLPRFRLFGDTVNVAARLQQHCPPGSLLLSEAAEGLLCKKSFQTKYYQTIYMKGLGEMNTFIIEETYQAVPDASLSITSIVSEEEADIWRSKRLPEYRKSVGCEEALPAHHPRFKTPTAWLTASSQLNRATRTGSESDTPGEASVAGAEIERAWSRWSQPRAAPEAEQGAWSWVYSAVKCLGGHQHAHHADAQPEGADATATPRSGGTSTWNIYLNRETSFEQEDVLPDFISSRLHDALAEKLWLTGRFVPEFSDPAREHEFRRSRMHPTISRALLLLGLAVASLFALPHLTLWSSFPAALGWCAATGALLRTRGTMARGWKRSCGGAQRSTVEVTEVAPAVVTAWALALVAVVGTCSCRPGALSALLPWMWLLLSVLQRTPLFAAVGISCVGIGIAALNGSMSTAAAGVALCILQWADEAVERRRYVVRQLELRTHGRMRPIAENLMPPSVVQALREARFGTPRGDSALPMVSHSHKLLTVMQADLVGFTAFARTKRPEEVLCVVNGLFSIFDKNVEQEGIYKMETIGDAYICASGLPDFNQGKHSASAVLQLAAKFVSAVALYKEKCGLPEGLGLRVGVHSGSCVGGVLGTTMQRYHLFGPTMSIAQNLEATAPRNRVHFSAATKAETDKEARQCGAPLVRVAPANSAEGLVTSKGERVPLEAVGGQCTFVLLEDDEEERGNQEAGPHDDGGGRARVREVAGAPAGGDAGGGEELGTEAVAASWSPSGHHAAITQLWERNSPAHKDTVEQLDLAVQWHSAVRLERLDRRRNFVTFG